MSRFTWRIATVGGIPIYLHWSFWLLIGWVVLSSLLTGGGDAGLLLSRLVIVGGLVLSVILHELGHAFAARFFGIPTRDITMYPFGGVASLARLPEKPLQELIVALAGPLVNFLLIGVFGFLLWLLGAPQVFSPEVLILRPAGIPSLWYFLYALSAMNAILAIFNLLPAFPMDGGRVLRALLAIRLPYLRATQIAALVGQAFAVLFILVGILGNPVLILVGFFVFVAATQERRHVEERSVMRGFTVRDAVMRDFPTLSVTQPIQAAVEALLASQARAFLVVDPLGQPAGSLSREQLIDALGHGKTLDTSLTQIIDSELISVPSTLPLQEAFRLLQEKSKPFLLVSENGHLLGLVDSENIAEFLLIRQALAAQ